MLIGTDHPRGTCPRMLALRREARVRAHRQPDNPHIPPWPKYSAPSRATLLFDDTCRVVENASAGTREVMEDVLGL